jgi:hypothetical protein
MFRNFRPSRHNDGLFASLDGVLTVSRSFHATMEFREADEALFRGLQFLRQATAAVVRGVLRGIFNESKSQAVYIVYQRIST